MAVSLPLSFSLFCLVSKDSLFVVVCHWSQIQSYSRIIHLFACAALTGTWTSDPWFVYGDPLVLTLHPWIIEQLCARNSTGEISRQTAVNLSVRKPATAKPSQHKKAYRIFLTCAYKIHTSVNYFSDVLVHAHTYFQTKPQWMFFFLILSTRVVKRTDFCTQSVLKF